MLKPASLCVLAIRGGAVAGGAAAADVEAGHGERRRKRLHAAPDLRHARVYQQRPARATTYPSYTGHGPETQALIRSIPTLLVHRLSAGHLQSF